jgi:two-component system nitrogen regulation sensor histidine kinase NtrY
MSDTQQGSGSPAMPEKPPAATMQAAARDDNPGGFWGPVVVVVALIAAIATFLVLMGVFNVAPRQTGVALLLAFDGLLVLLLIGMVGRRLWRLNRESMAGSAGARLHRRVVGLFSLVAAVPTALVAGAAMIALERGLNPWFSGDLSQLVKNADSISQNFQQQICQNLGREMKLMAADVDRANASGFFVGSDSGFRTFLTGRASALGFPHAQIFKEDGSMLMQAEISARPVVVPQALPEDFRDAATDEPPCLLTSNSIGGLIKLTSFGPDTYLIVARAMDPRALEFPIIARSGVQQYQELEARRNDAQFGIALVFALVVLIGLLGAILLGLSFADRLVDPIRRLMQATDQVSGGNLYVQVPVQKMGVDMAQLGSTFNTMTSALREQHDNLRAANDLIDQRRRFMEAVLAGVPAGVIGLDAAGNVTLINPTARQILMLGERDAIGHSALEILPEIASFLQEARRNPNRVQQTEVQMKRRGQEHILSVRATEDAAGGTVVTLDDITNLVTAQRSAAWADVARRIAHEIKNPLTPIQLSAERIRRKFGKAITEDRPIFDQCTDTIIRQVEDIKRMVDEFSSFARMPKPQPVEDDLVAVLKEVAFMMRVGNPAVTFEEDLPDTPVTAKIDRRLVAQALQNLMKNACEAIAESASGEAGQGRIRLSVAPMPHNGGAVLDITDNGKGFPKDNRQSLLEPYVTTRDGGTGLGLPIVAKIFEDHGGRIELLDPPAGPDGIVPPGARVRIHLPPPAEAPDAPSRT